MTPEFSSSQWKTLSVSVTTTAARLSSTDLRVKAANLIAPGSNSVDVQVGPDSNADTKAIAAGGDSALSVRDGDSINLKDWYAKTASGSATLKVLYLPSFG